MLTTPCSEYFSVRRFNKMFVLTGNLVNVLSGVHHWEPATNPYSCHDDFTDRSIFSLNLCQIQIPTGTSMTNCNHKHGLMSTRRHDVDRFTWGRIVLFLLKLAHVDWNWPISGKISKNRLVCKNAVALAYYGSCRLLVMGSWRCSWWRWSCTWHSCLPCSGCYWLSVAPGYINTEGQNVNFNCKNTWSRPCPALLANLM